jgi:DNA-binding FadR family transcriptional regulator
VVVALGSSTTTSASAPTASVPMTRPIAGRDRWIFRMTSDRDPVVACKEHHELCDAISAGEPDFAAAISYSHIERGRRPTLATLRQVLPP